MRNEIVRLYNYGASIEGLCRKFNRGVRYIRNILVEEGVDIRNNKSGLPKHKIEEVRKLKSESLTYTQIAEAANISRQSVYRIVTGKINNVSPKYNKKEKAPYEKLVLCGGGALISAKEVLKDRLQITRDALILDNHFTTLDNVMIAANKLCKQYGSAQIGRNPKWFV